MAGGRGFEWDDTKAASNRAAHGVPFETARRFDFERAEIMVDDRRAYGETRMVAVGEIDGRVHVLVYTERRDRIRVISLRKANRKEIDRYARFLQAQG
ncbi:MAG TPA: BrnT family toxin [Aurantimonas coralicida]|uniref:BrnT family toxin n=2 Tax=root TaxID=1 RepID=A0A9C9NHA5_9HYPH|nr:BrnT family toxin [Aurantimonas coralicida]HEU01701.1 BrnT family toxin [Aurantimonas coralicida]